MVYFPRLDMTVRPNGKSGRTSGNSTDHPAATGEERNLYISQLVLLFLSPLHQRPSNTYETSQRNVLQYFESHLFAVL
jgi:hypothetical protein